MSSLDLNEGPIEESLYSLLELYFLFLLLGLLSIITLLPCLFTFFLCYFDGGSKAKPDFCELLTDSESSELTELQLFFLVGDSRDSRSFISSLDLS